MRPYIIHCPYHVEITASCAVFPERGRYLCYGCHREGLVAELPKTALDECISLVAAEVDRLGVVVLERRLDVLEKHGQLFAAMKNSIIDDSKDTTVN